MELINTDKAAKPVGPYSQIAKVSELLFISGQLPIDSSDQTLQLFDGDAAQQAKLVLQNMKNLLASQGLSMNAVLKTTVFLADINDGPKVNEIYEQAFGNHRPARSTVAVSALPKGIAVEIEAIATTRT